VVFASVIVVLLPVIFYLRGTPDAVWSIYYLSPVTLWLSLDPGAPRAEEVTFTLGGVPVISIARGVYGALALVFLAAGVCLSRRRG
jgi:hypothetical protein